MSFPVPGEQGAVFSVSFREGMCEAPGAVVVELPRHADGITQTVVDADTAELRGRAFVIASAEDDTIRFCGDVPG